MHRVGNKNLNGLHRLTRRWKGWCFRAVERICSLEPFREGPQLLLKLAFSVLVYTSLSFLWYSAQISAVLRGPAHSINQIPNVTNNLTEDIATGGLRMIVFGGGDIATPTASASEWNGQGHAWTEIMCKKLGCDTYLSFVPEVDGVGGAVVSNSLLDAAYKRVSTPTVGSSKNDKTIQLDYSWIIEQYAKPYQHDLADQVDSFLSSARAQRASTESLWVFNVGYWDIWYLAALPRRLATEVIDSSIRDLFFQIEILYQAAQDPESIAYSEPNSGPGVEAGSRVDEAARAPFRIFLTRLFDISLTPGFGSVRPKPPHPHSSSSQLRNAAFLTKYWDALLEVAVDDWLATPDPEHWSTADTVDIKVLESLVGKRSLGEGSDEQGDEEEKEYGSNIKEHSGVISLPRRKVASYGISHYLRELMIDRQLRNSDLFDHNGLGARPSEDGFLDISMPCALHIKGDRTAEDGEAADAKSKIVVCQEPDNYLFYTGFTVGPRAIHEIGKRAARRFLDQVEVTSKWREKARMHKESGREGRQRLKTTKFTA
ncbi:hypothetical protein GGS24DRAFT_469910 [Hypoxylon argillaceum]|nr:hypothetical protein GGS24DRAFT_469910 [Hypoxylon argillaceum]